MDKEEVRRGCECSNEKMMPYAQRIRGGEGEYTAMVLVVEKCFICFILYFIFILIFNV